MEGQFHCFDAKRRKLLNIFSLMSTPNVKAADQIIVPGIAEQIASESTPVIVSCEVECFQVPHSTYDVI